MPSRTLVEELCDVCFADDDGVETDAAEQLQFGWLGRDYVLLVCERHVDDIRDQLQHLSEIASPVSGRRRQASPPASTPRRPGRPQKASQPPARQAKTLFSQLTDNDKARFRRWADMPNARRIGDKRVQEWIDAGRP
jgi:hypothetical protein